MQLSAGLALLILAMLAAAVVALHCLAACKILLILLQQTLTLISRSHFVAVQPYLRTSLKNAARHICKILQDIRERYSMTVFLAQIQVQAKMPLNVGFLWPNHGARHSPGLAEAKTAKSLTIMEPASSHAQA
jgi:hypothetical protein